MNKLASVTDYELTDNYQHIENIKQLLTNQNITFRWEHPLRKWEYGTILTALREFDATEKGTILSVGGGGSVLEVALAWLGFEVHIVDPGDIKTWIDRQSQLVEGRLTFVQSFIDDFNPPEPYKMTIAVSVVEHVEDDAGFLKKLIEVTEPGGLIGITTDFHPEGGVFTPGHLRTYNADTLKTLMSGVNPQGELNYENFNPNVGAYTFASYIGTTNQKPLKPSVKKGRKSK